MRAWVPEGRRVGRDILACSRSGRPPLVPLADHPSAELEGVMPKRLLQALAVLLVAWSPLAAETLIQVPVKERQDRVTELFDKYNLLALPVVDQDNKLTGVITADDIISVLRQK